LNLINALTTPLPANVVAYFANTFATGTGEDGLFLLTDFVGTPTGWVHNEALANTISVLNAMTSAGAFNTLTDPTTGGVSASLAMLGDINIAEPGALIAFAGPRVVKETIGRDLPDGFQTSEFLLEHGFLDYIIDRMEIREKLSLSLKLFMK
jgi:hypothetical protein